jgi:hypothetical protein
MKMKNNEYSIAGWAAIVAACMTVPLIITGIATDIVARRAPELTPFIFLGYLALSVFHMICGLYALYRFRTLLNTRYRFHRVDLLVTVIIIGVIVLTSVAIAVRSAFLLAGLDPKLALVAIPIMVAVSFPLAVIGIIFGIRILTLESDLNGYLKPLAYLTIAASVCFATFILVPIGLVLDAASNIFLGLVFLRPEPEATTPEFV